MPWTTKADVARHNKAAANDPAMRKLWKKVANGHLKSHHDEAAAIKIANGVVRKRMHESRFNDDVPVGNGPYTHELEVPSTFSSKLKDKLSGEGFTQGTNMSIRAGKKGYSKFKFGTAEDLTKAKKAFETLNENQELNEFAGFGNMAQNITNKVLSRMGSSKATGRYQLGMTRDQLYNEFNIYLGHQQEKPTFNVLLAFLKHRFGEQYAVGIARSLASGKMTNNADPVADTAPAQTNTSSPAVPNASAAPSTGNFYADKAKQAGTQTNMTNYQNNVFKQLNNMVNTQVNLDANQVMGLTRELLAHAKDHGGADKARVYAYLKSLRKNPRILNDPKLQRMFSGLRLESVRRVLDMAMYLVENDIKTKVGLTETYNRFFLVEKPTVIPSTPNSVPVAGNQTNDPADAQSPINGSKVFSRKELQIIFTHIAKDLLDRNAVTIGGDSQQNYYRKMENGRYQKVTEPTVSKPVGGIQPPSNHSSNRPAAPAPGTLDLNLLDRNLAAKNVDMRLRSEILSMIRRNGGRINGRQMDAFLAKHPDESIAANRAMHDAVTGQESSRTLGQRAFRQK